MKKLPALPAMLTRSLLTVSRTGERSDEHPGMWQQDYQAPTISKTDVQRYHKMFNGFTSDVPLTYLYMTAQRAHLAEMLKSQFPWPVLGMVHVSNRVEQKASMDFGAPLQLTIQMTLPKLKARVLRPDYQVEFKQRHHDHWRTVAICSSVYQVMQEEPKISREPKAPPAVPDGWQVSEPWVLTTSLGRDYARLSGDYNPIHLHPLTSRWFGFQQPIIHGMYMAGRAHAEIERHHQQALRCIDVKFKRPVILPNEVQLCHNGEDRYQLRRQSDGQIALEGTYQTAS